MYAVWIWAKTVGEIPMNGAKRTHDDELIEGTFPGPTITSHGVSEQSQKEVGMVDMVFREVGENDKCIKPWVIWLKELPFRSGKECSAVFSYARGGSGDLGVPRVEITVGLLYAPICSQVFSVDKDLPKARQWLREIFRNRHGVLLSETQQNATMLAVLSR